MKGSKSTGLGHAKDYLRETTVHGFRYVLEGRTRFERFFWVLAIATAFAYVAYFGTRSVREARDSPIASVVEIANTDNLTFPAVTVLGDDIFQSTAAGTDGVRFLVNVLNSLEFDCYHNREGDSSAACIERTRKVRRGFKPMIANFVEALLLLWRSDGMKTNRALQSTKDFDHNNCDDPYCDTESVLTEVGARFCTYKLVNNVTEEEVQELDRRFVKFLADNLRFPEDMLLEGLDDFIASANGSLVMQSPSYIDSWEPLCDWTAMEKGGTSAWMNVMVVVYMPEYITKNEFRLGDLINWSYLGMKYFDAYDFVAKRPGHVDPNNPSAGSTNYPDLVMTSLNQSDFTVGEVLRYFQGFQLKSIVDYPKNKLGFDVDNRCMLETYSPYDEISEACSKLLEDFKMNLDKLFKIMKWAKRPGFSSIAGKKVLDDMNKALDLETYPKRCNLSGHACHSMDPLLVNCQFNQRDPEEAINARKREVNDCGFFKRSLGPDGIGYTFNGLNFWDMYQRTDYLKAFYSEIHSQDIIDDFQDDFSYSARKTLDFTLHPSLEHAFFFSNAAHRSPPIYRLAIHHPSKFPLDHIKLEPGFRYTITINPSMITTDEDLITLPLDKRKCLFEQEAEDYSKIFKTYSQDGCLFECRLRSINNNKGCMPWNVPQLGNDGGKYLCNDLEASDFMIRFSSVPLEECDCPTDCNVHNYILGLSKEPMDKSCRHTEPLPMHPLLWNLFLQDFDRKFFDECVVERALTARVTIKLASSQVTNMRRVRRVTFTDQMANIGGLVGLFTGMSMLSLTEMGVWLLRVILTSLGFGGCQKNAEKKCTDQQKSVKKSGRNILRRRSFYLRKRVYVH